MTLQIFAVCSAKSTPAELLLPTILYWDLRSVVPFPCPDD